MTPRLIPLISALALAVASGSAVAAPETNADPLVETTGDVAAKDGAAALADFLARLADPSVPDAELTRHLAPDARLEWVATPTAVGAEAVVAGLALKLQDRADPRVTFKLIDARGDAREVEVTAVANSPLAPTGRPGAKAGRVLFAKAHVHLVRGADGRWLITRWRVGKWSVGR